MVISSLLKVELITWSENRGTKNWKLKIKLQFVKIQIGLFVSLPDSIENENYCL